MPLGARPRLSAGTRCYWGTYTAGGARYGTGESKGIYFSRLDTATGSLTAPELAVEAANPSFLAIHPRRPWLYAVNEHIDSDGTVIGEVSAFSLDRKTGKLTQLNRVSSRGGMPCHLCTDKTGKVLAVANWSTGSTASFPIKADGSLGEAATLYQHTGERAGGTPGQAIEVHCHSVMFQRITGF